MTKQEKASTFSPQSNLISSLWRARVAKWLTLKVDTRTNFWILSKFIGLDGEESSPFKTVNDVSCNIWWSFCISLLDILFYLKEGRSNGIHVGCQKLPEMCLTLAGGREWRGPCPYQELLSTRAIIIESLISYSQTTFCERPYSIWDSKRNRMSYKQNRVF